MKTHWIEEKIKYDGSQLRSLFAYLGYGVMGDSVVSWIGPCDITEEHMVDGEDLLEKSEIRGSEMLHFIFEVFDRDLFTGVFIQRLFASMAHDLIENKTKVTLRRDGDDIFWDQRKLSISIATRSPNSVMIHFAMNIRNEGTPVPTCALSDWKLEPRAFSLELMEKFSLEYASIMQATWKVKPVS